MTAVTRATFGDKGLVYLRDVLRNTLTDTQSPVRAGSSWIFKSVPDKKEIDHPFVVLNLLDLRQENLTLSHTHFKPLTFSVEILVWADKIADRDTVSDQIISTLSAPTSTDGTDTMKTKGIYFDSSIMSNEDVYPDGAAIQYAKRISVIMTYVGS